MTQPQSSSSPPDPQEITVRIDIKVKMAANTSSLMAIVDKAKAVIEKARDLGEVEAVAMAGRLKLPIV